MMDKYVHLKGEKMKKIFLSVYVIFLIVSLTAIALAWFSLLPKISGMAGAIVITLGVVGADVIGFIVCQDNGYFQKG